MSDRFKNVLAVGLVATMAWLIYSQIAGVSLLSGPDLPAVPGEPVVGSLADLGKVSAVSPVPLLGGTPRYDLGGRNLFQYGQAKPPPPSPEELERRRLAEEARLKEMEEAARRRREQEEARKKQQEEARKALQDLDESQSKSKAKSPPVQAKAKKAPPPPIDLKLIGYLGPMKSRIAVFYREKEKEIVLGRKGEVIEGRFRVIEVGTESVEMGYVDPEHAGSSKVIQLGS